MSLGDVFLLREQLPGRLQNGAAMEQNEFMWDLHAT